MSAALLPPEPAALAPPGAPRLARLPAYPMAAMRAAAAAAAAAGMTVTDLSMGDPDLPPPAHVIEAFIEAVARPGAHRYGIGGGSPALRRAVADRYAARFGVALDPAREVLAVDGAQGALASLMLTLVGDGDGVLAMDPGYAVHLSTPLLAGGVVLRLPAAPGPELLAGFDAACRRAAPRVVAALVGWPSAPEGHVASLAFLAELVALARRHGVWLVHDAANIDLWLEGDPPPSILQVPGVREVAVELYSLTKGYNLAGWRSAFVLGQPAVIEALQRLRSHAGHGPAVPVEAASIAALTGPQHNADALRSLYRARRDAFIGGLRSGGWPVAPPVAGFSVWATVPSALRALGGAGLPGWLITEAGVSCAPGPIFGPGGADAVRFTLVRPTAELAAAAGRIVAALRRAAASGVSGGA